MNGNDSGPKKRQSGRLLILLLLLGGTLAAMCHQGFLPHEVFWANDSALGAMNASSARLPGTFTGFWGNYWWIGGATPSPSPSLSTLFAAFLSPALYLKVYAPFTMLFLGFCVWFFFRQLRFGPMVCVIAGLGAGLNMHFFSNACWGLGTWCVSAGMVFVALAILVSPYIQSLWIKGVLAGLCVGMTVMEGFDVGAIFSIYVGCFVIFFFLSSDSNKAQGLLKACWVEALVVFFALFISFSTLYTLVGTQIVGTTNGGVSAQDRQARWDFTTQWSIPKLESLRVIIPGVFGYRMQEFMTSTNKDSAYWGKIAEDPRVELLESSNPATRRQAAAFLGVPPDIQDVMATTSSSEAAARENILGQIKAQLQRRHSGSGEYSGVLVCLLAVFALASALRLGASPFSRDERRAVWFWSVAAVFSLLAAWGRHGSVYRLVYQLPFLSNIRNPMKFMHPLNISLILLSGYGLEALYRSHLQSAETRSSSLIHHFSDWWTKVTGFEKWWSIGCVIALLASVAGFLVLNSSEHDLALYLAQNGFTEDVAPRIAAFCVREVGLFLAFFGLSAAVLIIILSGAWSGKKIVWAWSFLCAIMICDLARSDLPWIRYFNYRQKYSINPVVDFLRHQPWQHRVVSRLSPVGGYDLGPDANFGALCHWWLENDYPYNDIQSLEIDQAPRMPVLDSSYIGTFMRAGNDLSPPARLWRLTNTRYIFADAHATDALNQLAEPRDSFRTVMRLNVIAKPGIDIPEDAGDLTVETNSDGPVALIEFTRALPRAKLYSNWKMLDDPATLHALNSSAFDPDTTVLIATNTPLSLSPANPDADPGVVDITQYRPKDIILQADAKTPSVLLFNDRTGDFWNVWVDQQPENLLRCNYIMRGVFVPVGRHTIEFRYQPPWKMLAISSAAVLLGILLGGFVLLAHFRADPAPVSPSSPTPTPATPAAKHS
jgi:hypothetical protein